MTEPTISLQVTPGRSALIHGPEPQISYVLIEAQPPQQAITEHQLPINICLVLDRSSSMRGERLFQVKEAANHIVGELGPQDTFAVVIFNDRAEVVIPAQRATDKEDIKRAIMGIDARGGTEMATGIDLGLQELERASFGRSISQLLLLTDGRTYGDESRCVELARIAQRRGIGLTALGVGHEWNEDLLETIAAAENSRTAYIAAAKDIVAVFAKELQRLHNVFAQSVELELQGLPGSQLRSVYRVRPFIAPMPVTTLADQHWRIALGDWASLDEHAMLLELVVPPLPVSQQSFLELQLRYVLPAIGPQPHHTALTCRLPVHPIAEVGADVHGTVRYWLERTVAHRLQAMAWDQVAKGQIEDATSRLRMAGTRLLDAGEINLAQTVQDEATRLLRSGNASEEGRKRIKYGTRGLMAQDADTTS